MDYVTMTSLGVIVVGAIEEDSFVNFLVANTLLLAVILIRELM